MKKKQIIGLVIAVVLFIVTGVISVLTNTISRNMLQEQMSGFDFLADSYEFDPPEEDYIAVVRVEGTIQEQSGSDSLSGSGV